MRDHQSNDFAQEAIKVRTSPPSAAHVRVYTVVEGGGPSSVQHPTPNREGNPQHSPCDCHPGGSTPHQLQANLRDLTDDELWQLMEDLCWEVAPRDPPPTPWGNPVGSGDLNVDDQVVTFPRGGGWEPVGQPLQPLLPHNQVEGGNTKGNLFTPQQPLNPMKMWDTL